MRYQRYIGVYEKTDEPVTKPKIGDVIFYKNGHKVYKIIDSDPFSSEIDIECIHNCRVYSNLSADRFVKAKVVENEDGENEMTNKLFQVVGEEKFGAYLATNSSGQYVLEIKGNGEVKAFDKDKLEEVLPWTFSVKFADSNNNYHFRGQKDSVAKGDVLMRMDKGYEWTLCVVADVNTKSKAATKDFEGVRVLTCKI